MRLLPVLHLLFLFFFLFVCSLIHSLSSGVDPRVVAGLTSCIYCAVLNGQAPPLDSLSPKDIPHPHPLQWLSLSDCTYSEAMAPMHSVACWHNSPVSKCRKKSKFSKLVFMIL